MIIKFVPVNSPSLTAIKQGDVVRHKCSGKYHVVARILDGDFVSVSFNPITMPGVTGSSAGLAADNFELCPNVRAYIGPYNQWDFIELESRPQLYVAMTSIEPKAGMVLVDKNTGKYVLVVCVCKRARKQHYNVVVFNGNDVWSECLDYSLDDLAIEFDYCPGMTWEKA